MIEIKNITKTYDNNGLKTEVLKKVSLTIKDGEFIAIMGPSGSGKSTLMHIIGCLDVPTLGEYFLDGKDISKLSDDELAEIRMKKIGFVFQSFNLLPRATAIRNVALPLVYAGIPNNEREKRAQDSLRNAAFPEKFWDYRSNQLSGGMAQRVAIARALVNNPAIILADEPTGNLDTKTGELVLETFQKLHSEQKRTIILITHEKNVAKHAKRIIHLQDGEIIEDYENGDRLAANAKI